MDVNVEFSTYLVAYLILPPMPFISLTVAGA